MTLAQLIRLFDKQGFSHDAEIEIATMGYGAGFVTTPIFDGALLANKVVALVGENCREDLEELDREMRPKR